MKTLLNIAIIFTILYLYTLAIEKQNEEIAVLQSEKTILIESYLCNIQNYRKPLWNSEKELTEFKKWLRETAEREVK